MNKLFFGDNLDIMRELHNSHPEGFIDLVYIDPPFNSKRNYNILFEDADLSDTKAQKEAFADTWSNVSYVDTLNQLADLNKRLYDFLKALDTISNSKSSVSYLTTMAIRLVYIHKLLKDTGSFYLHCDPTMSHYLKVICDFIFGEKNFRNEIIWRRTGQHNKVLRYAPIHDVILFYTKAENYVWNFPKKPFMRGHIEEYFIKDGDVYKTNYYGNVLTGSGKRGGESGKPWKGFDPTAKGRHWAVPGALLKDIDEDLSSLTQHEKLNRLYELGYIKIKEGEAWPIYERYLTDGDGQSISDIWAYQPYTNGTVFNSNNGIDEDVRWLSTKDMERMGYPTQKPQGLLERIINASSNEGDIVADFFCGCGTTIAVAEKLKRKWLGVDISHLAVKLIANRLINKYGSQVKETFEIFGFPKDIASARELASETKGGRLKFEEWIVEVMLHGVLNENRTQMGYDGYFTFDMQGEKQIGMIEVKSGAATPTQLNHFVMTVKEKKGDIGVFVCFDEKVTKNMRLIAKNEGYYKEELFGQQYPKMQLISVEELINGKTINVPFSTKTTFKVAPKDIHKPKQHKIDF